MNDYLTNVTSDHTMCSLLAATGNYVKLRRVIGQAFLTLFIQR